MKIFKTLLIAVLFSTAIISCKKEASLKKVAIQIEGMSCQIGCAKTIESKLSKTDGIEFAKVSFDDKLGEFTFDANKISKEEIAKKISAIGDGDMYTATVSKDLDIQ